MWSVQLSVRLHSRPEILSSGSVSRVWFQCQLNKTFVVFLPDARQLISTVLRTAVQPLCTSKKLSSEGHTHWKRLASPKDLLLSKEFLTKPRIMERVSWKQHHWTRVKVSKHLNFDKDELKSFWKCAKERINPAKASWNIWCILTRRSLRPAVFRTLSGDVSRGWGGRASLRSGEGRDEATRGPSCPEQPQPRHRCFTLTTLQPADFRRKQEWN